MPWHGDLGVLGHATAEVAAVGRHVEVEGPAAIERAVVATRAAAARRHALVGACLLRGVDVDAVLALLHAREIDAQRLGARGEVVDRSLVERGPHEVVVGVAALQARELGLDALGEDVAVALGHDDPLAHEHALAVGLTGALGLAGVDLLRVGGHRREPQAPHGLAGAPTGGQRDGAAGVPAPEPPL